MAQNWQIVDIIIALKCRRYWKFVLKHEGNHDMVLLKIYTSLAVVDTL